MTESTERLLDLEELLLPLATENPAGRSLRETNVYFELDDIVNDTNKGEEKWEEIAQKTDKLLKTESKDLRLVVRLAEAMAYQHGLAGANDSLKFLTAIHQSDIFWASVFPRNLKEESTTTDENGQEIQTDIADPTPRASQLRDMAEKVSLALKTKIRLTEGQGEALWLYSAWEALQYKLDNLVQLSEGEQNATKALEQRWEVEKQTTSLEFYQKLLADVTQCGQEFQALEKVVIDRYGNKSPNLKPLATLLKRLQKLLEEIIEKKGGTAPPAASLPKAMAKSQPLSSAPPPALVPILAEPIFSREEAVQQLRAIATFFRATERHNPLPWLIELGIAWGDMPLDQWLKELKTSGITLDQLIERLHLAKDSSDS